jgi:hypothetical protein
MVGKAERGVRARVGSLGRHKRSLGMVDAKVEYGVRGMECWRLFFADCWSFWRSAMLCWKWDAEIYEATETRMWISLGEASMTKRRRQDSRSDDRQRPPLFTLYKNLDIRGCGTEWCHITLVERASHG